MSNKKNISFHQLICWFILVVSSLFCGCRYFSSDYSHIVLTVKFVSKKPDIKLENIETIIGDDKMNLGNLKSGEEKSITMLPNKNVPPEITVYYTINEKKHIWESTDFQKNVDYKIILNIDEEGKAIQIIQ